MLTPPDLSADMMLACLRESYGLRMARVTFQPIGQDVNNFHYRADAEDGTPYFLRLRRGDFDEVAVAVPAFLRAQGILAVMAPIATVAGRLWASAHGFAWMLYPFFVGTNGCQTALSDTQWVALGQSLRAVHSAVLPAALAQRVPREEYSPQCRDLVREFDRQVDTRAYDDPVAARLAKFWIEQRHEIRTMVERAEQLGQALRHRADGYVLCHADLHAGNILLGAHDALTLVDWDNPIFAPKEHDLMCIGAGLGFVRDGDHEQTLFFQGYGSAQIDPIALSYYRYERIVADLAAYGAQIFGMDGSVEDREEGVEQLKAQFLPLHVVDVAHQTYERLD